MREEDKGKLSKLVGQIRNRMDKGGSCKQIQADHKALERAIERREGTPSELEAARRMRNLLFRAGRSHGCKIGKIKAKENYRQTEWGSGGTHVRSQRSKVSLLDGLGDVSTSEFISAADNVGKYVREAEQLCDENKCDKAVSRTFLAGKNSGVLWGAANTPQEKRIAHKMDEEAGVAFQRLRQCIIRLAQQAR